VAVGVEPCIVAWFVPDEVTRWFGFWWGCEAGDEPVEALAVLPLPGLTGVCCMAVLGSVEKVVPPVPVWEEDCH
jgi:hypothetical protein